MKKRIIWSIAGIVFGGILIAGGFSKMGSNTADTVECGGRVMLPGDICETTSKRGVKSEKTFDEQRKSNETQTYLIIGLGGLLVLFSAWKLIKALRTKNPATETAAPLETWNAHQPPAPHPPAPQPLAPQPPAPQPPGAHPAIQPPAPPRAPAAQTAHQPQQQWPAQPPPPQWPAQQQPPQQPWPAQPSQQQWPARQQRLPQEPQHEWTPHPGQEFGPTGELPQDQPAPSRQGW